MSVSDRDTLLIVDDDASMRRTLVEVMEANGHRALGASGAEEALELLQAERVDLVLTDLRMPGIKGDALLREIRATFPEIPVIAMTAFGSVRGALELTRAGAVDYLEKPFGTGALLESVAAALRDSAAARQRAQQSRSRADHLEGIVGGSAPMLRLFDRIARVAPSPAPVLITGESGTGKELVARAVHRASGRGPLLAVNCGAIPEHLLESELFGHRRGAFTGATQDKEGLFQAAHGGTLLLDEVGELSPTLQPKLLRALETGEVRRVGDVAPRPVDVRILALTNRDLEEAVEEGSFRSDLFYRLRVLHLEVPALRERPGDVRLLVDALLQALARRAGREAARVSPAALACLEAFHWPGNVRQLLNTLEASLTFASGPVIEPDDLPAEIRRAGSSREIVRSAAERGLTLAELERDYIYEILERTGGNKSRAAELLGIPRRTLYRRLEEYAASPAAETSRHTGVPD